MSNDISGACSWKTPMKPTKAPARRGERVVLLVLRAQVALGRLGRSPLDEGEVEEVEHDALGGLLALQTGGHLRFLPLSPLGVVRFRRGDTVGVMGVATGCEGQMA